MTAIGLSTVFPQASSDASQPSHRLEDSALIIVAGCQATDVSYSPSTPSQGRHLSSTPHPSLIILADCHPYSRWSEVPQARPAHMGGIYRPKQAMKPFIRVEPLQHPNPPLTILLSPLSISGDKSAMMAPQLPNPFASIPCSPSCPPRSPPPFTISPPTHITTLLPTASPQRRPPHHPPHPVQPCPPRHRRSRQLCLETALVWFDLGNDRAGTV